MATEEILRKLAAESLRGEREVKSINQFYKTYSDMEEKDGYIAMGMRLQMMQEEGYRPVGFKLGGTSIAKSKQVLSSMSTGSFQAPRRPAFGFLMDYMQLGEDEDLQMDQLIHPKLEPELAFVLDRELKGPFVTVPEVMMATAYVAPAYEIIDSRFHDFKMGGKADVLIDNVSSARFKLGKVRKSPFDMDLAGIGIRVKFNDTYTGFGAGGAVLGHPARAVASLANTAYDELKISIPAGSIILTGAICVSRPLRKGDWVVSDYDGMGSLNLRAQ